MLLAALLVLGFSPDGRYVAYIQSGVGEGSGFPWATVHVLDVARGAPALADATVTLDSGDPGDSEEKAIEGARKAAGEARAKLRVAEWVAPRELKDGAIALATRSAGPKQRAKCEEPFQPLLLKIAIRGRTVVDDRKPRGCATSCVLDRAFGHGRAALVFVQCDVLGFEGPATALWPVTVRAAP